MGRLFWKIFLGFWLTLVITGAGVGAAFYVYSQARLAEADEFAEGPRAESVVATTATVLSYGGRDALRALYRELPWRRRLSLFIVDDRGADLFGRPVPPEVLTRARAAVAGGTSAAAVRSVTAPDGSHYLLFIPARIRGGHPPHISHQAELVIQLGAGLVASLLFSAVLAWYLSRPLRHLRAASHRLAAGELGTRVMPDIGRRRDEIADLGADFDHMAARLQNLVDAQKRLLHDVSHELRSPLARLRVAVGLAHQQPERQAPALDRIEREAERLDELVGQVLTLSRLEAGVNPGEATYLDLEELLEEVAEDARFEAEAMGRQVELEGCADCTVRGRAELLRRAFENVIRNAIRHTAPDTVVTIAMTHDAQGITVAVCDSGPGVAESELGVLFEPFFRAEGEAAQPAGYGLGLAIAKRAIEAYGGSIVARNRAAGGLCVDIALPLAQAV